MSARFDDLWQDFLEGGLDGERFAAFDQLLRDEPGLAVQAAELWSEHRLLSLALRPETPGRFVAATRRRLEQARDEFSIQVQKRISTAQLPSPARQQRRHQPLIVALAAAAMLVIAGLGALLALRPTAAAAPGDPAGATPIATLVRADGCRWDDGATRQAGQRLPPGSLALAEGRALVRFDGGALALLVAPTRLQLDSPGGTTLLRGQLTVHAPESATGFRVRTPVAVVTDLGTEFALEVDDAGVTGIQVLEGEVSWAPRALADAPRPGILRAGEGLRLRHAADRTGEVIPVTATPLASEAPPRPGADHGRLLSYDGFDYAFARSPSHERRAAGGTGWRGAWYRNQPTNDLPIEMAPGASLDMPPGLVPAVGGSLLLPAGGSRDACMRIFAQPIVLDRDGVVYISCLLRRQPGGSAGRNRWLRIILTSLRVSSDRVGFALQSDDLPQVQGASGNVSGTLAVPASATLLLVGKIASTRGGPAQLFLHLQPAADAVDAHEPAAWMVSGQPVRLANPLDALHIHNGVDAPWLVDELRLGTSWQSVTPRAGR